MPDTKKKTTKKRATKPRTRKRTVAANSQKVLVKIIGGGAGAGGQPPVYVWGGGSSSSYSGGAGSGGALVPPMYHPPSSSGVHTPPLKYGDSGPSRGEVAMLRNLLGKTEAETKEVLEKHRAEVNALHQQLANSNESLAQKVTEGLVRLTAQEQEIANTSSRLPDLDAMRSEIGALQNAIGDMQSRHDTPHKDVASAELGINNRLDAMDTTLNNTNNALAQQIAQQQLLQQQVAVGDNDLHKEHGLTRAAVADTMARSELMRQQMSLGDVAHGQLRRMIDEARKEIQDGMQWNRGYTEGVAEKVVDHRNDVVDLASQVQELKRMDRKRVAFQPEDRLVRRTLNDRARDAGGVPQLPPSTTQYDGQGGLDSLMAGGGGSSSGQGLTLAVMDGSGPGYRALAVDPTALPSSNFDGGAHALVPFQQVGTDIVPVDASSTDIVPMSTQELVPMGSKDIVAR